MYQFICIWKYFVLKTYGTTDEFLIDKVDNSKDQEDKADEYRVATDGEIVVECNKRLHKLRNNCIAASISSLQLIKVINAMAKQHWNIIHIDININVWIWIKKNLLQKKYHNKMPSTKKLITWYRLK